MARRDQKHALNSAYRSLARRAHSRRELQEKLERKKYTHDTIQAVLAELETKRILDDRAFAISFSRDLLYRRQLGRDRVALELKTRGIADDLIEETLGLVYGEIDEQALAQKVLNKRLHVMKRSPTVSDRRRLSCVARSAALNQQINNATAKNKARCAIALWYSRGVCSPVNE